MKYKTVSCVEAIRSVLGERLGNCITPSEKRILKKIFGSEEVEEAFRYLQGHKEQVSLEVEYPADLPRALVDKVIATIKSTTGITGTIFPNSVIGSLGLDSLDCVEVVMALESEFEIDIDDALEVSHTVADVSKVVFKILADYTKGVFNTDITK